MSPPFLNTPIVPLLRTVFTSILEVFLLCVAGYALARNGILDKKTQKQLNKLNVSLFTPALLFSKVAFFLSPAKLRELWIIPLFFVVVTSVSMSVAFVLGWLFRLKRSERNFAMAAAMFMNSNSLPIALMQSLVVTMRGLKWGDSDNKNAMLGRALTYLVLYSTLGMVLRWSYGVKLLAKADDAPSPQNTLRPEEQRPLLSDHTDDEALEASYGTLGSSSSHQYLSSTSTFTMEPESDMQEPIRNHPATGKPSPRMKAMRRNSTFYRSFPNSPNQSRTHLPAIDSREPSQVDLAEQLSNSETDVDADPSLPLHQQSVDEQSRKPRSSWFTRSKRRLLRFWIAFNDFMTVPLWAALASVIVACIQPMQHALENHMQPVKGALTSAGNCSIPLTLVVLGAYFYPDSDGDKADKKPSSKRTWRTFFGFRKEEGHKRAQPVRSKSEVRQEGETKTVIIAVASRMIITPMLILPGVAIGTYFDLHTVFLDPVFVVSSVLLISSPPALTLAQITNAASGDAFERLISRTIFWSYCIITPPATVVYVVIGLILAKL